MFHRDNYLLTTLKFYTIIQEGTVHLSTQATLNTFLFNYL